MVSLKFKLAVLSLLYFVQGMPYGFQDKLVPVALRSAGSSFSRISLLKLLLVPWLLKTLWAPLLTFKTNKFWLILSTTSLSFICLIGAMLDITNIWELGPLLLTMNFFCATQDIAVDTLAVNMLSESELGYGNTAQVIGYKFGSLFAGGALLWLHETVGNAISMLLFSLLYLTCSCALLRINISDSADRNSGVSNIFPKLWRSFISSKRTLKILLFITIYKLGERGCLSNFPIFLVDRGIEKRSLALWNGVVAQGASILGSAYGGYVMTNPSHNLATYSILRSIPILIQFFLVTYKVEHFLFLSVLSLTALNFFAGVITTITFSLMMSCSKSAPEELRGTHYTTLATAEVLGKLLFSSYTGTLIDAYGLSMSFALFFVLSVLIIPFANSIGIEGLKSVKP